MGMTFSEFGRRIQSNASGGPTMGRQRVFVFGEKVQGGVIGRNPTAGQADVNDNIAMQYDFRSVYSTLLENGSCRMSDRETAS